MVTEYGLGFEGETNQGRIRPNAYGSVVTPTITKNEGRVSKFLWPGFALLLGMPLGWITLPLG